VLEIYRRTRWYFSALAAGSLGTGAAYVAVMLVAYERLGSAWASAAVLLAEMLPGMLLGPLIGVWVDGRDRVRCAVLADAVRAAAFALLLVAPGWSVLGVACVVGAATTVFRPAAFALLDERMGAVALWGALGDAGTMLGPALAAGALALGGPSVLLVGVSGLFAVSALLMARVTAAPERDEESSLMEGARAGLAFVRSDRVLRVLVGATGVIVLAAGMMNVGEVLLAERVLGAGGVGFAALIGLFGAGAVLGSLVSARSQSLRAGYLGGLALLGCGLLGSALAPGLAFALCSFFVTGLGQGVSMTHDRALVQALTPERMRSRTQALIGTIEAWGFAGAALLGGTLASLLGARGVFAVSGLALLFLCLVAARLLLRTEVRHVVAQPA
jgi:MFS family permease